MYQVGHNANCPICNELDVKLEAARADVDIEVENHGTVFLFRPTSEPGRVWLKENVDEAQWFGGALACEPRFAEDLAQRVADFGLLIR